MAPYAGCVREGRFTFQGRSCRRPRNLGGHSLHWSVFVRRWEAESDCLFGTELGPAWPMAGWARREVRIEAGGLGLSLEVHSARGAMPASCGWHPWFRRVVAGVAGVLDFRPGFMYERDETGIATRRRQSGTVGPWDRCFGEVERAPAITWPGVLRLELESTCGSWVVFTKPAHALCVEPQTAPPDALNHDPFVVEPGRPPVAGRTMRWSLPDVRAGGTARPGRG